MLVFSARVQVEAAPGGVAAGPGDGVDSLLLGAAVVVHKRLAYVVAVVEDEASGGAYAGVLTLEDKLFCLRAVELRGKLMAQPRENFHGLIGLAVRQLVAIDVPLRERKCVRQTVPRVGLHADVKRRQIA